MQQDDKTAERVLREQRKWAKADQVERDKVISEVMAKREGRNYVSWLLEITHALGETAFTGHALSTSFHCGEQNVGQQIMAHVMDIAPDEFLLMWKERANERTNRQAVTHSLASGNTPGTEPDSSADTDSGTAEAR